MTLAETILDISRQHLRDGGLILAQNAEAVQNVHGTVPVGEQGVTILPTSETAMAGVAIGTALSGKPMIYILRFSSFTWLQASPLVNYAGIAKELWGYDIPLFVRILAMDGGGPTHSGSMVSILAHRPGLAIAAPCTPIEYQDVWGWFQEHRQPVILNEHRSTYQNSGGYLDKQVTSPRAKSREMRFVVIATSSAREMALRAAESLAWDDGIGGEVFNLLWLNPIENNSNWAAIVDSSRAIRKVVVADCAYEPCSIAEHVAYRIASETGAKVRVVGIEPRLSGVAARLENGTPSAERIAKAVKDLLSDG